MIRKVEVVIGYKCNFRCKYCYEQYIDGSYTNKKMDKSTIEATCTYIKNLVATIPSEDILQVSFFGGENFLYLDIIDQFINNLKLCDRVRFKLITNGSLVAKNFDIVLKWKQLIGNRLSISVSYDYCFQDEHRCKNTYQKVRDAILMIDQADIRLAVIAVLTGKDVQNFHLMYNDYLKLRQQIKHRETFLFRFQMDNQSVCQVDYQSSLKSLQAMEKFLEAHPDQRQLIVYKYGGNRYDNCGMGWRVLAGVDYDGSLYPCQGAIYDDNKSMFRYGNVKDNFQTTIHNHDQLIYKLRWPIESKCRTCNSFCKRCPLHSIKTDYIQFGLLPPQSICKAHQFLSRYLKKCC